MGAEEDIEHEEDARSSNDISNLPKLARLRRKFARWSVRSLSVLAPFSGRQVSELGLAPRSLAVNIVAGDASSFKS